MELLGYRLRRRSNTPVSSLGASLWKTAYTMAVMMSNVNMSVLYHESGLIFL